MMSNLSQKEISEQLTLMGFTGPEWDSYHINKSPPPALCTTNVKPVEMTKKQLFVIKTWPKVASFFQEDEDPIVIANAETVAKNGQLTRVFRIGFDNETGTQRWQFVFEKCIDTGLDELSETTNIRQIWARTLPDPLPSITEKFFYSRSFDTQASSSKFKTNCENGIVTNFQKGFLQEIKNILVEAYQSQDSGQGQGLPESEPEFEDASSESYYYKGKEFQFEENGHHITWTISTRQVDITETPTGTWFVEPDPSVGTVTPPVQATEEENLEKNFESLNPFEEENDDNLKSDVDQQQTIDRQIVEEKILDFIGEIWGKVRNFYLEFPEDESRFATQVVRKNGFPTQILELHFDTLNERNRWKFVFEVSVASRDIPSRSWAQLAPGSVENYFEARTYESYEKRGTNAVHADGEEKNNYFMGFYKRWFLSEVQWKLVKCFGQVGFFTLNQTTDTDPHHFTFGKDLEFSDKGDLVTWSFSVQKLAKYPLNDAPSNVWCYGITDTFLQQAIPANEEGVESEVSHDETVREIPETSQTSDDTVQDSTTAGKSQVTKSKSRIKTLARNIVKPVMEKTSWFKTSGIFRVTGKGKGGHKTSVKEAGQSLDDTHVMDKKTTKNSGKSNSLKRNQTLA